MDLGSNRHIARIGSLIQQFLNRMHPEQIPSGSQQILFDTMHLYKLLCLTRFVFLRILFSISLQPNLIYAPGHPYKVYSMDHMQSPVPENIF